MVGVVAAIAAIVVGVVATTIAGAIAGAVAGAVPAAVVVVVGVVGVVAGVGLTLVASVIGFRVLVLLGIDTDGFFVALISRTVVVVTVAVARVLVLRDAIV